MSDPEKQEDPDETERVMEIYEVKIPRTCEQCPPGFSHRPKVMFLRRMWADGATTACAFVCTRCAEKFRKKGKAAAKKISEVLEANGGITNVD